MCEDELNTPQPVQLFSKEIMMVFDRIISEIKKRFDCATKKKIHIFICFLIYIERSIKTDYQVFFNNLWNRRLKSYRELKFKIDQSNPGLRYFRN